MTVRRRSRVLRGTPAPACQQLPAVLAQRLRSLSSSDAEVVCPAEHSVSKQETAIAAVSIPHVQTCAGSPNIGTSPAGDDT